MARLRNQGNTATLLQFDDTAIVLLNEESLEESSGFETELHQRYGQKDIVKRQTGLKNVNLPMSVVLAGSSRDTNLTTLRNLLRDNEFIYFDSESHQAHLDGVYAPKGQLTQRKDEKDRVIYVKFQLVEKEA